MNGWKDRILTAHLAFAALALGTIHSWSIAASCALATAVFLMEWIPGMRAGGNLRRPGILCFLALALAAFTALQLAPLPTWLLGFFSPRAVEIRSALHWELLNGHVPAFMPISLDTSATTLGLMKTLAAALTFLAVRQRVRKEGSRSVLWCVAVAGLLVAVVSIAHRLTGWDRVYDIYEPLYVAADPLPAPFLNANHLAGALGLAAAVTVGLALDEKEMAKRVSLLVAAGFTGGALLLTLSRGGILCFVAGQILFIGLRLWRKLTTRRSRSRGRGEPTSRELAALPLSLGVAVAAGSYVALRSIVEEFAGGDASKFQIWQDAFPLLGDYWLTGSGRGTFQMTYTAYQQLPDTSTFTHPENFLANWMGDWGIVAGGLLVLFLVAVLVMGLLRPPRRSRNAGALVAIFTLMVQNFADFGLELPGILLLFMVCLGVETIRLEMWLERRLGRTANPRMSRRACQVMGAVMAVGALVTVGAGTAHVHFHALDVQDARLRSIDMQPSSDARFEKELHEAMRQHPADYHLPQLGGIRAYHTRRGNPLPLLARSLDLYPGSAVSHLYVGRTLARAGKQDQALVEYMVTVRRRPRLVPMVADEVIRLTDGFQQARKWARLPGDRLLVYEALAEAYLRAHRPHEARRADVAALAVDPEAPGPLKRSIRRHMDAEMWSEARKLAMRLASVPGERVSGLSYLASIESARGRSGEAVRLYEKALAIEPEHRGILEKLARIHFENGDEDTLLEVLDRLQAASRDEREKGRSLVIRAQYMKKLGKNNQALATYLEAARCLPDDASIWKAVARLQEQKGDPVAALEAYRELERIEPENPVWSQKVEDIVLQAKTRSITP